MNNNWSEQELLAAVKAYVEMHRKEAAGIEFTKRKVYADLADKFDRTAGAFEYRMQNISYVYSLLGRNWVSGLKPAKNVGSLNLVVIERLINTVEGRYSLSSAEFESAVSSYLKKDVLLFLKESPPLSPLLRRLLLLQGTQKSKRGCYSKHKGSVNVVM